jgi:hypothetical protein
MKRVFLLLACVPLFAATPAAEIKVDQTGYVGLRAGWKPAAGC